MGIPLSLDNYWITIVEGNAIYFLAVLVAGALRIVTSGAIIINFFLSVHQWCMLFLLVQPSTTMGHQILLNSTSSILMSCDVAQIVVSLITSCAKLRLGNGISPEKGLADLLVSSAPEELVVGVEGV